MIAIVETARGLRDVRQIAESGRAACLALGAIDLAVEIGIQSRPDGQEVLLARSQLVLESAAAGLRAPIDQVNTVLDDVEQLEEEVALARSLGMRGKMCIHPRQLEPVNRGFGPTEAELAWARELIDEFERAEVRGARGARRPRRDGRPARGRAGPARACGGRVVAGGGRSPPVGVRPALGPRARGRGPSPSGRKAGRSSRSGRPRSTTTTSGRCQGSDCPRNGCR